MTLPASITFAKPDPATLVTREQAAAFCTTSAPSFTGRVSTVSNNVNNAINNLRMASGAAQAASTGAPFTPLYLGIIEELKPEHHTYGGFMKAKWAGDMLRDIERKLETFKDDEEEGAPDRDVVHYVFSQAYSLFDPNNPQGAYYRAAFQQAAKILGLEPVVDLAPSLAGVAVAGAPVKTAKLGVAP